MAARPFEPTPMQLSAGRMRGMVNNITNEFRNAPANMRAQGRDWYPAAHDFSEQAARHMDIPAPHGAGIVAALSPGQHWGVNKAQVKDLANLKSSDVAALRAGDRSVLHGRVLERQSTDNILKAQRIREGESPESVLPMKNKTGNFYRNISDPSDPNPVTIDTHAHDLAVGRSDIPWKTNRGLQAAGRYNNFANAYRAAAGRLEVPTANEVQAVTWDSWRARKPGRRNGGGVSPQMENWAHPKTGWADL